MARHLTANQPRGYARGVAKGLIILFKNSLNQVGVTLTYLNAQFPVIAAAVCGHSSRVERFVVAPVVKAHVEGGDRDTQTTREQPHQNRGVNSSREKGRHRHITFQMRTYRTGKTRLQSIDGIDSGPGLR